MIYGLNLARGSPEAAAEEAAYVSQATGSRLLAFEIGNEPDVFGSWRGVRSRSYDFSTFLAEWKRFRDTIVARVPGARFAGPAIANQQGWVRPFVDAVGDSLVLVTRHYYADGPALASHLSLGALLSSAKTVEPILMELRTVADSHGLLFRIEETNSIYMEGQPGLSDAFASALWGLEFMFQMAHAGGEGVNFHTGDAKAYTPIGQGSNGNHVARPLYYGMLMFKEATRGAILVPTRLTTAPGLNMAVHATRTADGTIKLCLINKDLERAARVQIEVEDEFATTSILRLTAPSASAQTEITFGGAIVDERGRWSAQHYDVFPWRRNSVVEIQAASAALAQLSY